MFGRDPARASLQNPQDALRLTESGVGDRMLRDARREFYFLRVHHRDRSSVYDLLDISATLDQMDWFAHPHEYGAQGFRSANSGQQLVSDIG